jgi:hypothetical protein
MSDIAQILANLESWLETMRGPDGYGGPVVHWWQNCLSYTGPGRDWRYEGIIHGYLTLWQRTGQQQWLEKACRAGDDLVQGQLPGGNFRHSSFELNPYAGGTPHEAACDLALLRLALALREGGEQGWQPYARAAERNLRRYYLGRLWDEEVQSFRDDPAVPSLVPNKACTLAEALFVWAELRGDDEPIHCFALPALRSVLTLQEPSSSDLGGAIAQSQLDGEVVRAFFPYYNARCLPALLKAYQHTGDEIWWNAALSAADFIWHRIDDHGILPQAIYPRGENRYPTWIAPLGDVLRAAALFAPYGITLSTEEMLTTLVVGQLPSGGFITARGFGAQITQKLTNGSLPDFRDCIPVVGWCDKAFRYLVAQLPEGQQLPPSQTRPVQFACHVRGQPATWTETDEEMRLLQEDGETLYLCLKGQPWAQITAPELLWK